MSQAFNIFLWRIIMNKICPPKQTRRPLPLLLSLSFFYGPLSLHAPYPSNKQAENITSSPSPPRTSYLQVCHHIDYQGWAPRSFPFRTF